MDAHTGAANRVLLDYLSEQAKHVQAQPTSLSACSASGGSPLGISPPSSIAGNRSLSTGLHSPTSTAYTEPRFAKLSDRSALTGCGSPVYESPGDASPPRATSELPELLSCPSDSLNQTLPTSLGVTSTTNVQQAASLINLSLTQPGVSSFVLTATLGHINAPGAQGALCTALRTAITARRMHNATGPSTDLAIMPMFSSALLNGTPPSLHHDTSAATDCVDLHVYPVTAGLLPPGTPVRQLRADLTCHPMMLALHLAQEVVSGPDGGCKAVELVFGPAATRLALSVLTQAHSQLAAAGHEAILLPHSVDGAVTSSQFMVTVVPTALSSQAVAQAVHDAHQLLATAQSQETHTHSHHSAAPLVHDRVLGVQQYPNGMGLHSSSPQGLQSLHSSPPPSLQSALSFTSYNTLGVQNVLEAAAEAGAAAAVAAVAATSAVAQQQALQQLQRQSSFGAAGSSASAANSSRSRTRKADWVIVTEDTAIKNAAGAVAKVLGRVSVQGLCCPVFMERKQAHYTGVVSVAVKAIAVARGYVHNEASGYEVGFQPYFRGDASACAYGAARPPGAPCLSAADTARSEQLSTQLSLLQLTGSDLAALELLRLAGGSPPGGMSPRSSASGLRGGSPGLRGGSPPLLGGSPPVWGLMDGQDANGGSAGSSHCGDEEPAGSGWGELEQAELAFDVYKVVLSQQPSEGNSLPVKVTAHSRPGVVSSIIYKLIVEKESAVLITAGGRAMHVAMLAVVTARQRLQAQGMDILLLPKFVTVDTTQTLGWESVFLKFFIIRWNPAQALVASVTNKLAMTSFARTSI